MSNNHNNIYNILGKLNSITPKEAPAAKAKPQKVYESVDARGSILEGVEKQLAEKYMGFKKVAAAKGKKLGEDPMGGAGDGESGVYEGEAFVSDDVWRLAKQLSSIAGKGVEEFGPEELDMIANKVGLDSSEVAEILELTQNEDYASMGTGFGTAGGVVGECSMCEAGTCTEHAIEEGETIWTKTGRTHKGTYGSEYSGDDEEEAPRERGVRGAPKKADSEKSHASLPWGGNPPEDKWQAHPQGRTHRISDKSRNSAADAAFDRDEKSAKVLKIDEKAVSKAQQEFMGMVHAAQQGGKPASPEVAKVAKGMTKKSATDYASTKHKGLPQHVAEGINYKRMMEETSANLDEMIKRLSGDIKVYNDSGVCSDLLRDCLDVHGYAKRQIENEAIIGGPSQTAQKFATPAYQRKAQATPGDNSWMINQQDFDQKEREMPTTHAGMAQRHKDLGLDVFEELNKLAKLAGVPIPEQNMGPGTGGMEEALSAEPGDFGQLSQVGKTQEGIVCMGAGGDPKEWIDGIFGMWQEEGITSAQSPDEVFASAKTLKTTGGRTDLVLQFKDGANLNMGKMAMWRLRFGDCSWISDYKQNYATQHGHEEPSYGDDDLDEATVKVDAPVKPVNGADRNEYWSIEASTDNPGEGDGGKKRMYPAHPAGDNGMTDPARKMPIKDGAKIKEDVGTLESRLAAEYESIKKVSK